MSSTSAMATSAVQSNRLIAARSVSKSFGKRQVLREVDLDIAAGFTVGLVGENGSGKSTLLRILVGLLQPTSGTIERCGRIGYCPQEALIVDGLTADENFRYFAAAYGLPASRWRPRVEFLLDRLHFAADRQQLVSALSGGTRQKLNLAIALLHEPEMLVLDEPYAGFDWATYQRFWQLAHELRVQGTTILVVSHLIYDRSEFDHVVELRDGRLEEVVS